MDSCDNQPGELTATKSMYFWSNGPLGAGYTVNSYESEKLFI